MIVSISEERLRDMRSAIAEIAARPDNSGHGHVFPRPDGSKARCGGSRLCAACKADHALKDRALPGYEETYAMVEYLLREPTSQQEDRGGHVTIEHDGFAGTIIGHYETREGKKGVVVQQDGTRVVHVYGEKWIKP